MRKLASVQKIKALEPIEGADAIEKATVLGWQLVVKKNEFRVGDLAVYCEIDSVMPDKPEFEFLKPRGMRIKTIRLKGQVSQGICFPLSILPESFEVVEDADCTDVLGITKYEPPMPACLVGVAKGRFPSFIPKTDETRVQILQEVLDEYKGAKCYITEKLDGSSATYYIKDGEFGVCSRNLELLEDDENSFWKVAKELKIEEGLRSLGRNIAIQGELIGEGIQGNRLKIKGHTVMFFNAFDIDNFKYLSLFDLSELLVKIGLTLVPIVGLDVELTNDIESIVKTATIKSALNKDVWAEGIVIRPYVTKNHPESFNKFFGNGMVSFKAINPEFLIKYQE
jgi:RNA ligase (TIGR02306 family)